MNKNSKGSFANIDDARAALKESREKVRKAPSKGAPLKKFGENARRQSAVDAKIDRASSKVR